MHGTTYLGGAHGQGTAFVLDAAGQYKILYRFQGQADGSGPWAGVTLDSAGGLYGTAAGDGGVLFKVTPQ